MHNFHSPNMKKKMIISKMSFFFLNIIPTRIVEDYSIKKKNDDPKYYNLIEIIAKYMI